MRLGAATFALATVLWSVSAPAQEYPSRPVLFVVPYAPGGRTESMARLLGRRLEQRLGKPFGEFNAAPARDRHRRHLDLLTRLPGMTMISCSPPARPWRSMSAFTATSPTIRSRT